VTLPSKEEKFPDPKIKTWYENEPDIFHREKTIEDFAINFFPVLLFDYFYVLIKPVIII
jgi:hypothetical protein